MSEPVGTFCLVLHTHLPWLNHHGAWPVGEEWLHQAWAASYDPVVDLLTRLGEAGASDQVTLGVTPVLAAMLDDPYSLAQHHTWLGYWQTRASGWAANSAAAQAGRDDLESAHHEYRAATAALERFESKWRHGGSAVIGPLVDAGVIDVLSGPLAHPFQPLLDERFLTAGLAAGLDDTALRIGQRPGQRSGIWAPECGYRPGLARQYQDVGVSHLMMDGPTFADVSRETSRAFPLEDTEVVAFGRDLSVTYRVWSPTQGYPRGPWYRDFHTYEHEWGFHPARVTGVGVPPAEKAPYRPARAAAAVAADAVDFVRHVRRRLLEIADRDGSPGLVVAGFDTELFGHWWHEGPQWLEQVLRLLPTAGIRVSTLRTVREEGRLVGEPIFPRHGSWGAGKGFDTWAGDQVADFVRDNDHLQATVLRVLDALPESARAGRSPVLDQLARSAFLGLQSDWAFMVTKDSAAEYARRRHFFHHSDTHRLASLIASGGVDSIAAHREAQFQRSINGPFGHLDGRTLLRTGWAAPDGGWALGEADTAPGDAGPESTDGRLRTALVG